MKVPEYMQEQGQGKRERSGAILALFAGLCVVNVAVLVVGLYAVKGGGERARKHGGWSAEQERALAARLMTEGLREQALEAFERYLARGTASSSEVANVAYMMGKARMELQQYEAALGDFYRVELADGKSKAGEEARRAGIVCLERLGRLVDARYALDRETALRGGGGTQAVRGVVVAKIGDEEITSGEMHDYMQRMPAGQQKELDTPKGREEVLRQILTERLLYKKGQMAGMERTAEIRQQLEEIERQLVVQRVVKEELGRRLKVTEEAVKDFYEKNKERFGKMEKQGTNDVVTVPRFEVVRSEVERMYRAEEEQRVVEELIGKLTKAYRVQVYSERLGGGK